MADVEATDGENSYLQVDGAEETAPEAVEEVATGSLESTGRTRSYVAATSKVSAPELDNVPQQAKPAAAPAQSPSKTDKDNKMEAMMSKMEDVEMEEYKWDAEKVAQFHQTDLTNGLSSAEAQARIEKYGYNRMTPPKQTPWWVKFLGEMVGGFATLLWTASILCFIAYGLDPSIDNLILGTVLAFVVIVTGIFSYFQESKSDAAMKKFAKMVPKSCIVYRDGKMRTDISPEELVVGDIIEVKNGDKVPADIRVIQSNQMKVDNASLTGESEPQKRSSDSQPEEKRAMEAKCLAFFTTLVVNGSCKGVVIRTGDQTVIGQIQSLVTGTKKLQTPINMEIEHFIHLISAVAIFLGVTFFIIALIIKYTWIKAVVFLIGIIVANVPEGLLATVTVCLTLTAIRMSKQSVLVKNLESVETLGSTSCICSDKTGTLTQNKMTVVHTFFDGKVTRVVDEMDTKITGEDEVDSLDANLPTFKELFKVAQLGSVAEFVYSDAEGGCTKEWPHKERVTAGDASESAILKFCDRVASEENGFAVQGLGDMKVNGGLGMLVHTDESKTSDYFKDAAVFRTEYETVLNVPFNSKEKYAGSVRVQPGEDELLFVLKGAPERIIKKCNKIMMDGQAVDLTDEHRKNFDKGYISLGKAGERVLGFALKKLDPVAFPKDFKFQDEEPFNGITESADMVFVGLMALIDPPREAVPKAVKDCMTGGIQVIMVTGDHPITAKAIAKSVQIIRDDTGEDLAEKDGVAGVPGKPDFNDLPKATQQEYHKKAKAQVVNGEQLQSMTDDDIDAVLAHDQVVFARTSPQQKLQIVQGCQRNGKIVAVTGDGVNDSPALKAANIGVAMGIAGSDVSKEAADMILLNDDFASIVVGVKEGRIVFDNLKKSIAYTLTSNIPEISPFLLFIILSVPLPLSTIMILAIDLGTDMYPAISMAYEGPESDIMLRKPRDPKSDNLVTLKLLQYTYLQIGMIQASAGFFTYFVVMGDCGFRPSRLLGLRADFDDEDIYSLTDSYNAEWTYDGRLRALRAAQTSYFTSIVIVQWADLIICKTRILSVFQQGMRNRTMNQALVFETLLAAFITYTPGMETALTTAPLQFVWWLPPITFSFLIFVYDECRKYLMRKYREENNGEKGWVERTTYY